MIDIINHLHAVHREVVKTTDPGSETVSVRMERSYDASVEDVWEAMTDPERVRRWFLPLTGDLRESGTFQLEGNAGGAILRCDAPRLLRVTFGGDTSIVEVRLTAEADGKTRFELTHEVPFAMAGSTAGALWVGPGWDGALLGLGLHLQGEVTDDPVAAANSLQSQEYLMRTIEAWTTAIEASGAATADEIAAAADQAAAQFAPDLYQQKAG